MCGAFSHVSLTSSLFSRRSILRLRPNGAHIFSSPGMIHPEMGQGLKDLEHLRKAEAIAAESWAWLRRKSSSTSGGKRCIRIAGTHEERGAHMDHVKGLCSLAT
jgi:hypothetical protein